MYRMPITATPILDRLLSDKLVSQERHDLARQRLDALPNEPYSNAGEALIWLRTEDILSDSDLEEMETLSMSQAGFAGSRAAVHLAEVSERVEQRLRTPASRRRGWARGTIKVGARKSVIGLAIEFAPPSS